ncbi:hypothetical protein F4811DRAFT_555479 [Daldinia bambusicola]|nr:hypothetical protein F4811DRAFT_555479 [Daldinia bambusicola]
MPLRRSMLPNPAPVYPPCVHDGSKQFLIRHWQGISHSSGIEDFLFELYANFSGYAALCHASRIDDAKSGWTLCDSIDNNNNNEYYRNDDGDDDNDDEHLSRFSTAAYFDFSSNDYIAINHTFTCDRGAAEPDAAQPAREGSRNGERAAAPRATYATRRAPAAETRLRGRVPVRRVGGAGLRVQRAGRGGKRADGRGDRLPGQLPGAERLDLLDPDARFPCPISYRDDLIPPEAYPETGFRFNRSSNEVSIEQK